MLKVAGIIALALLAGACGGGAGGTGAILFQVAPNLPGMSGYIRGPAGLPIVYPSTAGVVWAGDGANNTAEIAYYGFNISSLPPGSQIVEAVFHVGQGIPIGSPFTALGGQLLVDHVNLGNALDPADYASPIVYTMSMATLSTGATPLGSRSANITSAVQADLNGGRVRTDIRLRFPVVTNADNSYDSVRLNNVNDDLNLGVIPRLEIRYRAP